MLDITPTTAFYMLLDAKVMTVTVFIRPVSFEAKCDLIWLVTVAIWLFSSPTRPPIGEFFSFFSCFSHP